MKIVFVARNSGYLSRYEDVLSGLLARGHQLVLAYQDNSPPQSNGAAFEARMRERHPGITFEAAPVREDDAWSHLAVRIRRLQDYLRYFMPALARAMVQRKRIASRIPVLLRVLVTPVAAAGAAPRAVLNKGLVLAERAIPISRVIATYLRGHAPDLLLVTPLVEFGSSQVDYVRAAQTLGIRTGLCVASWDNLTHKGAMRVTTDRVFVWNEAQKIEAAALHGVPAKRVVVTGAPLFDWWFEMRPTVSYEAFCTRVGLDGGRPFLLYLGSSSFISPNDATLVERWIRAVRTATDPVVVGAGLLIRPHPNNAHLFRGADLARFGNVVVWDSSDDYDPQGQADYFHSVYHASAVVGINTSAMIEAGIVGKSVCTLFMTELAHAQTECPHFHYLTTINGGLLHVGATMEQHIQDLSAAILRGRDSIDTRSVRFTEAFVRPLGLTRTAASVMVDAVHKMAAAPPLSPVTDRALSRYVRFLLIGVALATAAVDRFEGRAWIYPIRLSLWVYTWMLRLRPSMWRRPRLDR